MVYLIDEIYLLMKFVVPGFIFHAIYAFLVVKKDNRLFASLGAIKVIVTSFIFVTAFRLLCDLFTENELGFWVEMGTLIFLSSLSPFIIYKIRESRLFKFFLFKTAYKAVNSNLWKEAIDYDNGTIIKMYLKNQELVYTGLLAGHEENGSDSWFQLRKYLCGNLKTGSETNSADIGLKTTAMIPLSEVERVELFYTDDSIVPEYWKLFKTAKDIGKTV